MLSVIIKKMDRSCLILKIHSKDCYLFGIGGNGQTEKNLVHARAQLFMPKQIICFKMTEKQTKMKSLCCCQT